MTGGVRVISPGLLTTVQDLGRYGHAHLGVSASGPADSVSARVCNRLVQNDDSCSVLEMTLVGGHFEFGCGATVALAGADFRPTLDGTPVPLYEAVHVVAGAVLRCGSAPQGARTYLSVAGGFQIPAVLGSTSTHVTSGIGGLAGRSLMRGDILPIKAGVVGSARKVDEALIQQLVNRRTLRVTAGPQQAIFGDHGVRKLCSHPYVLSEDSNRLGLRLHGRAIEPVNDPKMLTEGAALGAIQIPPGGNPIILFVEHQTTGGYPKIANVISADLPAVGQLRPRDEIHFELVTMHEAIELLKTQEEILNRMIPRA
jgi:antagonist of KipI